ncbi:MAG: hypothetical protein R3F54_25400 [Alphaproteobacteria bacterium]
MSAHQGELDRQRGIEFRGLLGLAAGGGHRLRFGADGFVVDLDAGGLRGRRDEPEGCAVVVATDPMSLASVVYGGRPTADAVAHGDMTVPGERVSFERFVTWFPLPDKMP